jgi:hypothetical protein
MADTTPKDLQTVAQPDTDKNYFNFKSTGLKIDKTYAIKFQWVYPDGTKSDWSPGYFVNTNTESVPVAPTVTVTGGAGFIQVSLPTFPANASRVDVRIAGGIFGDGTKVADSFSAAGTKTIAAPGAAAPGLQYIVTLLTVTPSKINGDPSSPVTVYVTDPAATLAVEPSETPSTPTVTSVLGAIQLAWNGKTSTGEDQPLGFDAAKVYVGTSAGFTPVDTGSLGANQVDILNFANGQNTLNISVGTIVNGVALTYNTGYYVKIKTTNGNVAQDSIAVSATGNPVQIGKVGSGDIVTVLADQIQSGTIESQVITVGTASGKHIKLNASGNPIAIYGTGGVNDPLLTFGTNAQNQSVLTIKGSGTFSGDISAASGTFTGNLSASAGTFSVNNGVLNAQSGIIGGWTITGSLLHSSPNLPNQIELNPATPKITLSKTVSDSEGGPGTITIDPVSGIKDAAGNFKLTPAGILTLKGSITSGSSITGAIIQSSGSTYVKIDGVNYPGTIQLYAAGYATPGFIDVSGSWPTNEFEQGEISMSPPIATGSTAPTFLLKSDTSGGYALIDSATTILGDINDVSSGGVLRGSWVMQQTDGSASGRSRGIDKQIRNIAAFQGSGPPSSSLPGYGIGDIILFYA